MADVFISYHEASAGELAEQIADALDAAGISSWCARRDLPFGGDFAREIPSQIHDCRLFLLLLTEDVYHSEHIESEVGIAFSRLNKKENIIILPLELGTFERKDWVEYYLIHKQSVKFPAQPDERRIERLVKRIARTLNPQSPPSAKIIKRGECGDRVTYTLDENGVLIISGSGAMRDFWWDKKTETYDTPWRNERETISLVKIENGVTAIGDCAFSFCAGLTSITIPDSVTYIGRHAFKGCAGLTSVTIPDSVTEIGDYVFAGCAGLTSVTIPDNVTYIGAFAFKGCAGLISVTIPDSVTEIGAFAFKGCAGLISVAIPDSVTYIGRHAFSCTKLKSVSVPAKAEIWRTTFPRTVRITRRA